MEPFPDRLPLVIGVTGHRDLRDDDLPKLEQEVAAIVATLRRDYLGNSPETPVIILSSLAEGADRLVARVALAHGAQLVAPMPMPVDEYRRDFEPGLKPGNTAEFDALLGKAIAAPVMPFAAGNSIETIQADRAKRAEQYRAVGRFIAQHCNVLIALWNGDDKSMSAGGTTEVVTIKRHGVPLAISGSARASIDVSEAGPVIHVLTPRVKAPDALPAVSVAPWGHAFVKRHRGGRIRQFMRRTKEFIAGLTGREPGDRKAQLSEVEAQELAAWEAFEALTKLTANFNREAAALVASSDGPRLMEKSIDYLFDTTGEQPRVDLTTAKKYGIERAPRWCRLYAIADALAQRRRVQFRRDWLHVYALAFIAFFCFLLFPLIDLLANAILILYCLAFIALFAVFVRALFGQHQIHFLDYRALAEALRIAIYWKLAGIIAAFDRHVPTCAIGTLGAVADAYPMQQPNEMAWVKLSLRMLELVEAGETPSPGSELDPAAHAIARHYWVYGQYTFYGRGERRHTRFAERLENTAIIFVVLSPFVIVPLIIAFTHAPGGGHSSVLRETLLFISGLLPGLATVVNGYSEKLALKAQARQYDRMRALFGRAFALLPDTITSDTAALAQATYVELGREALEEHAEWVAIYRQRPIEPPK
jgi:hypothetical protein